MATAHWGWAQGLAMYRGLFMVFLTPCVAELAALAEWIRKLGGFVSPKLEIQTQALAGRGLFVNTSVQQGETLLSIPYDAILFGKKAVEMTPCQHGISEFFDTASHPENAEAQVVFSIMLFLLHISIDSKARNAWPHLDFLLNHWGERQHTKFPLFWTPELIVDIAGTTALELYSIARAGVEREYSEVFRNVCPKLASRVTYQSYQSIWALVNSRILTFPASPSEGLASQPALVPIFDMVNHQLPEPQRPLETQSQVARHMATSLGRFGPSSRRLSMWLARAIESGEEVTDVYGLHSNQEMLWKFGFTVPWIHNLTCLTKIRLSLELQKLDLFEGGVSFPPELISNLQPFLHFELGGCARKAKGSRGKGQSLGGILSFLRAWLASARASLPELHKTCAFESPETCLCPP